MRATTRGKQARSSNTVRLKGGAYTDIRELIDLRYATREIDVLAARRASNPLSGLLTSRFRGRGIDFAEVRVYQPGDDIRTIDWRVTARTEIPHTKLFQEEKERPVMILADQSHSMFFGSRVAFKSVVACEAAALLAWTALERGDRTGGMVFSESGHRDVRPRRNKHSVLRLINELNDFNHKLQREPDPEGKSSYLGDALRNVRRVAKHGSAIFIISDFAEFNEEAILHFNQLAQHNDVVGIQVSDPLERDLPDPDLYMITNGHDRQRINTANKHYRTQYHELFMTRLARARSAFARMKAPLLEIQTHEPVVTSLATQYNAHVAQSR